MSTEPAAETDTQPAKAGIDLFGGLSLSVQNTKETLRLVAELSLFELFLRGDYSFKGKPLVAQISTNLNRLNNVKRFAPEALAKLAHDQVSNLIAQVRGARMTEITFITSDDQKKKVLLPVTVLSPEAKKRIHGHLVSPMRERLQEFQQNRKQYTYADKLICNLQGKIDDVSRMLRVREPANVTADIASAKAAFAQAKAAYEEIKHRYQEAAESNEPELERGLERAREEMAVLAAELQKLQQNFLG